MIVVGNGVAMLAVVRNRGNVAMDRVRIDERRFRTLAAGMMEFLKNARG